MCERERNREKNSERENEIENSLTDSPKLLSTALMAVAVKMK